MRSGTLDVVLTPARGADVHAIVERASGVDVLFHPWWAAAPADALPEGSSLERFFAGYAGGWQVLCPNAGEEREGLGGARWGFHGEACQVPWRLEVAGRSHARCSVRLQTAPLELERMVSLDGAVLRLEETVKHAGGEPIEVAWVHHPAFGAPLVGPGCRLATNARRVVPAGDTLPPRNLARIPDPGGPAAFYGHLTDFEGEPWAALSNSRVGIGVTLRWSADPFPHAWLWQECGATAGYPWFGRANVVAIEPASTPTGIDPRADGVRLAPGERRTAWVQLCVERE